MDTTGVYFNPGDSSLGSGGRILMKTLRFSLVGVEDIDFALISARAALKTPPDNDLGVTI
jgi:hypothetical protein